MKRKCYKKEYSKNKREIYQIKNVTARINSMKGLGKIEFKKDKKENWRDEKIKGYKTV